MKRVISKIQLCLLVLCVQLSACSAENTAVIKGKALEPTTKILAIDMSQNMLRRLAPDTLSVVGGAFQYTVPVVSQEGVYMFIDRRTNLSALAIVEADGKTPFVDLTIEKATGTPLNDRMSELVDTMSQMDEHYWELKKLYDAAATDADRDVLVAKMQDCEQQMNAKIIGFIENNQDNILPAIFLPKVAEVMDFAQLRAYSESGKPYTLHPLFKPVKEYVDYMKPQAEWIGKKFVDVVAADLEGKKHHLSEYVGKGNYVLVDFWASWCGPCMREMPVVKECWEKYKGKGFNVVGISLDNDASKWRTAIENGGLGWPHISDLGGWKSEPAKAYGVQSIPWNILCDGEGKIVAVSLRGQQLKSRLENIYSGK